MCGNEGLGIVMRDMEALFPHQYKESVLLKRDLVTFIPNNRPSLPWLNLMPPPYFTIFDHFLLFLLVRFLTKMFLHLKRAFLDPFIVHRFD